MNKGLELEAEKYVKDIHAMYKYVGIDCFIAGAKSKYVEKQKLKIAIEENRSILNMLKLHSGYERLMLPCIWRIEELEQQLKKLQS